jgi:hypothetical protein
MAIASGYQRASTVPEGTPLMNRRGIILMLIGVIASIAGFATSAFLAQRRCIGAGGRWEQVTRICRLESGDAISVGSFSHVVTGVLVGVVLAFMLYRVQQLAMGRMSRRSL